VHGEWVLDALVLEQPLLLGPRQLVGCRTYSLQPRQVRQQSVVTIEFFVCSSYTIVKENVSHKDMKDIIIFENFINDEELEEVRQFIGEESLNINGEIYDESNPFINRQWFFNPTDNVYKKGLVDLRREREWAFDMESLIPSAKKSFLKLKIE